MGKFRNIAIYFLLRSGAALKKSYVESKRIKTVSLRASAHFVFNKFEINYKDFFFSSPIAKKGYYFYINIAALQVPLFY